MIKRGQFFVLDGVDGAGKGEQLKLLKQKLPELYPNETFVFTREPGGSPYAEAIRSVILDHPEAKKADAVTMAQLFGAARFDHIEKLIDPAIRRGEHVISDRFDSSTFAFQLFAQEGGPQARSIFKLQRVLIEEILIPWTTVILDLDIRIAMERSKGRTSQEKTHFDVRDRAFHEKVRAGFKEYAREAKGPIHFIDATRSIAEVHEDVLAVFKKALG